jgi:hypothetical protein
MNKIKIYRDSKEIPVRIIERIESTGDFFYMIKGYEYGDEPNATQEELKEKFEEIFQGFILEINSKHIDIVQYGKIVASSLELDLLMILYQYIVLKIKEIKLSDPINRDVDVSMILEMLSKLKIQKNPDLEKQLEIIEAKINKHKNVIEDAKSKINKNADDNTKNEKQSIYDILINVGIVLDRQLNPETTTLYELGKLQEIAIKKIESDNKHNK